MKIACCIVAKNEARFLPEWLAYHSKRVFDTILVYDNNSYDETGKIARAFAAHNDVRLIEWRSQSASSWQTDAYRDVLAKFGAEFDWMAFIDADEFVVASEAFSLRSVLAGEVSQPAVALPWKIYGSSGHVSRSANMVIETYTRHSTADFGPNRHIKSIVRPSQVSEPLSAHCFAMQGYNDPRSHVADTGYVWANRKPVIWMQDVPGICAGDPDFSRCWLNHYFVKSREDWRSKIARGYNGELERPEDHFDAYDRNECETHFPPGELKEVYKRISKGLRKSPLTSLFHSPRLWFNNGK